METQGKEYVIIRGTYYVFYRFEKGQEKLLISLIMDNNYGQAVVLILNAFQCVKNPTKQLLTKEKTKTVSSQAKNLIPLSKI